MKLIHEEVLNVLPHRAPMLFVDEVAELEPLKEITASLYIDEKWDIFKGHFPGDPVFPGALSVEALAQALDITVMTCEEYAGKTPLFAGINNVKFKKRIDPGDTVTLKVSVSEVDKNRDMITAFGEALTDGSVATQAELRIAMR